MFLVGSRRYNEWQTLAFEATKDREEEEPPQEFTRPLVDRPSYHTPNTILVRLWKAAEGKAREAVKIASKFGDEDSTTSETIDEVTKENEAEDEKSPKLVVNMINTIKETQRADPEQNQLTDRDLSNVNHDPRIVDRDPIIIDHES